MSLILNFPDLLIDPAFDTVSGTDLAYSDTEKGIGGDYYKTSGDEYLQILDDAKVIDQDDDFAVFAVLVINAIKGSGQGVTLGGTDGTSWIALQLMDPATPDQITRVILSFFDGSTLTTTTTTIPTIDVTTDPVIRLEWEYRGSTGFPQTSINLRNASDAIIAQIDNNLAGDFSFANFGVINRPDLGTEAAPFSNGFLTKLVIRDDVIEGALDITVELVIQEAGLLLGPRPTSINLVNRQTTVQRWINVEKMQALRDMDVTETQLTAPITNFDATQIAQLQSQFREGLLAKVLARFLEFLNTNRLKFDEVNLQQVIMDYHIKGNELFRDIALEFHTMTSEDGESIGMMGLRKFTREDQLYGPINLQGSNYSKRPIDDEDV